MHSLQHLVLDSLTVPEHVTLASNIVYGQNLGTPACYAPYLSATDSTLTNYSNADSLPRRQRTTQHDQGGSGSASLAVLAVSGSCTIMTGPAVPILILG